MKRYVLADIPDNMLTLSYVAVGFFKVNCVVIRMFLINDVFLKDGTIKLRLHFVVGVMKN